MTALPTYQDLATQATTRFVKDVDSEAYTLEDPATGLRVSVPEDVADLLLQGKTLQRVLDYDCSEQNLIAYVAVVDRLKAREQPELLEFLGSW